MGQFQSRLFQRPLTYSRPMKYPTAARAASKTATTKIPRPAGKVLCVPIPAAITAMLEEYKGNGNRCRLSASLGKSTGSRGRVDDPRARLQSPRRLVGSSTSKISNSLPAIRSSTRHDKPVPG
jgi:hypothetical protein